MLPIWRTLFSKKGISLLCMLGMALSFPSWVLSEEPLLIVEASPKQKEHQAENDREPTKQVVVGEDNKWQTHFDGQVRKWMDQLSEDAPFKNWKQASWKTYPFGPGSRQWVVLIFQDSKEIGYLMIAENRQTETLQLIEYGKSDQSILTEFFTEEKQMTNMETASQAEETRKFMYSGLLWAKQVNNKLVDLLTKETYEHVPLSQFTPFWLGEHVSSLKERTLFTKGRNKEPIVYLGRSASDSSELQSESQDLGTSPFDMQQSYYYVAELMPNVTGLYKVQSIHKWETDDETLAQPLSRIFVGLEDDGIRFLSYRYLHKIGNFSTMP